MAIDDLKTKINELTSESELRELRNYADTRLQSLKEAKEMENKSEHENRYKGKYLLLYGRTVSMTHSEVNKNEMRIVHVEDINFVGRGFFRCKVKSIHINFDDEWKKIAHITGDWGSAYVSYTVDDNFDLREEDIDEIISKEKAMELITNAKEDFNNIITTWDI